jgi:hypothetical protein
VVGASRTVRYCWGEGAFSHLCHSVKRPLMPPCREIASASAYQARSIGWAAMIVALALFRRSAMIRKSTGKPMSREDRHHFELAYASDTKGRHASSCLSDAKVGLA